MDQLAIVEAFRAEAGQLAKEMLSVGTHDWSRPTGCPPWDIADLLAHVLTTIERLPDLLDAPAPARAEVSAVEYYRADRRFGAEANADRVEVARRRAESLPDGHTLAREFDRRWRQIVERLAREPADRLVRTRHADSMLLGDFLLTRILELGVHGLDLAAALRREPWLTRPASTVLTRMLLAGSTLTLSSAPAAGSRPAITGVTDGAWPVSVDQGESDDLGWDAITLLRKVTGREPMTALEVCSVERQGLRWLTVG